MQRIWKRLHRSVSWEVVVLILIVAVSFFVQVRHLHLAAAPVTDEGVHTEVGRMMLEGYLPYRDFSYLHPPVLSLFAAGGLAVFRSMYPVRIIFLLCNVLATLPLFAVFKKITGNAFAALMAVAFHLSFHEMLFHDFRFLATRQLANVFFIGYLYWAVVRPQVKWSAWVQGACAFLGFFTFFPVAANFVFSGLAVIAGMRAKKLRRVAWRRSVITGGVIAALTVLFFLLWPGALERLILIHMSFPSVPRLDRFFSMLYAELDVFYYALSALSLLLSAVFLPRLRAWSIAMFAIMLMIFVPGEYFPHYVVVAAVAFAFGAATFVCLIFAWLPKKLFPLGFIICLAALAYHASITLPSLLNEWSTNLQPVFYEQAAFIHALPEPILMFMEPMYAIEADRSIVQHYNRAGRQFFGGYDNSELERLAGLSCAIVLPPWDQSFVPQPVQEQWGRIYTPVARYSDLKIWLTGNPWCGAFPSRT